jgi:hypothetical protein
LLIKGKAGSGEPFSVAITSGNRLTFERNYRFLIFLIFLKISNFHPHLEDALTTQKQFK